MPSDYTSSTENYEMVGYSQETYITSEQADEIIFLLSNIEKSQFWIMAAIMFVAGMIPIVSFFLGKGQK